MSANRPFSAGSWFASIGLKVVLGENLEVYLVQVKLVVLPGSILNSPMLDRSLRCNDGGRIVIVEHRVELIGLTDHIHEEGVAVAPLGEVKRAVCADVLSVGAAEHAWGRVERDGLWHKIFRRSCSLLSVGKVDGKERPPRIFVAQRPGIDAVRHKLRMHRWRRWGCRKDLDTGRRGQLVVRRRNRRARLDAVLGVHRDAVY
jgi:hypothetical protein